MDEFGAHFRVAVVEIADDFRAAGSRSALSHVAWRHRQADFEESNRE